MNVPTEAPKLPNFFIVGAPKCGTTAWVEYLRAHPDVFFPNVKDQCYFALDLPNFRLTKTPAHYAALYANCGAAKVVGEASAMYLFSTAAARAIRDHDPASKILNLPPRTGGLSALTPQSIPMGIRRGNRGFRDRMAPIGSPVGRNHSQRMS